MKLQHMLSGLGLLLGATAYNAHASLTSYNGAGNVGLVYSSVNNVTWTQDANLLGTFETTMGYNNAINAIMAVSPTLTDTPNFYDTPANSGYHSVTASDFSLDGSSNWFGAKAFVGYLNSINYGGSNQWRLPTSNAISGFDGTAGNELGQLFYSELGGTTGGAMPNTATFNNEQVYSGAAYWLGREYAPNPDVAWYFSTMDGRQDAGYKGTGFFSWAVSPGQVAAVPVPGAIWLMGIGLLGLVNFKRRGNAG